MAKLETGRPISLKIADSIFKEFNNLKKCTIEGINVDSSDEQIPKAQKFIKSNHNAFVFDREMVMRFFDRKDGKSAEYLIVLHGAHPVGLDAEPGSPTVVLLGVEEIPCSDNNKIILKTTLSKKEAATQYPSPLKLNFLINSPKELINYEGNNLLKHTLSGVLKEDENTSNDDIEKYGYFEVE